MTWREDVAPWEQEEEAPAAVDPQTTALNETLDQTLDAQQELDRPLEEYLTLPWPTLAAEVGLIAPGNVWMVCAFSGRGKTTFLTSLVRKWLTHRIPVYYMGLETRPKALRTYFAAYDLGHDPGDVLSGQIKTWASYRTVRQQLKDAIGAQYLQLETTYPLHVAQVHRISAVEVRKAFAEAKARKCRVVVVDHVDHIQTEDASAYQASMRAMEALDDSAKQYDLAVVAASQLNNDVMRGDAMAQLQPPQPHHVYMGGHKRHHVTGMLGLYRMPKPDVTKEDLAAVRRRDLDALSIAAPGVMGVSLMKHRHYGSREGRAVSLWVRKGKVVDPATNEAYD